eukprot:521586_1
MDMYPVYMEQSIINDQKKEIDQLRQANKKLTDENSRLQTTVNKLETENKMLKNVNDDIMNKLQNMIEQYQQPNEENKQTIDEGGASPIKFQQLLQLTQLGINENAIKFANITMESDQYVVIREQNKISIVNTSTRNVTP